MAEFRCLSKRSEIFSPYKKIVVASKARNNGRTMQDKMSFQIHLLEVMSNFEKTKTVYYYFLLIYKFLCSERSASFLMAFF